MNFYIIKDPALKEAAPLYEYLQKKGIATRHKMNFPGLDGRWLRFAIRKQNENNQLMEALSEWKNQN